MPLLSQPLVELCLRISTYVLIKNAVSTGHGTAGICAGLPPEIIKRRNKGRIDQHIRDVAGCKPQFCNATCC